MTIPKPLRWIGIAALATAATLGLAALLLFSPLFRPAILSHASALLSRAAHQQVRIAKAEGAWPHQIILDGITVADPQGTWLDIDRLEVRWQPLALLRGRIILDEVTVGAAHLARVPASSGGAQQPLQLAPIRRALRRFVFDRLVIGRLTLDAPVFGQPGVVAIAASLKPDQAGVQTLAMAMARKDAPGDAALALKLPRSGFALALRADVADVSADGNLTLAQDNGALGGTLHFDCGGAAECVRWPMGHLNAAHVDLTAAGTIAAPKATANLALDGVQDGRRSLSHFTGSLNVTPDQTGIAVTGQGELQGTASGLPELIRIVGDRATWSLNGALADGALRIERFAFASGDAAIELSGIATARGMSAASAVVSARRAGRLIGLPDADSALRLALRLDQLQFAPTTLTGRMEATVERPPSGMTIPAVLSGTLKATSAIALSAQALSFSEIRGTWGNSTLSGSSTWTRSAGGIDHGATALTVTTAPAAIPGASHPLHSDVKLSGGLATLAVNVSSTTDGLALAGVPASEVTARASARKANNLWSGTVDIAGQWRGAPLHVASPFNQPDATTLALTAIETSTLAAELRGSLRINTDSGLITGGLAGPVKDVAPLFAITGLPASGRGRLALAFAATRGQQLSATLDTGAFEGPDISAESFSARLAIADAWHKPSINARVATERGRLFGRPFSQVSATANGSFDKIAVTLQARNTGAQPLTFDAGGTVAVGAATDIALDRLGLETAALKIRLTQPARVTLAPTGVTLSQTQISVNDGTIVASLQLDDARDQVKAEAKLTHLSIGQFTGPLPSSGQSVLDGTVTISGAATAADIDARVSAHYTAREAGISPIDAKLQIANHQGRAVITGTATGLSSEDARLSAEFPVRVNVRAFKANLDMAAPIKGALTWHGDIKPLWQLFAYDQHALAGQADLNVSADGTLAQPRIQGGLKLSKATYENFSSGTALRNLEATLHAENTDKFTVSLTANDTDGGKIAAQGSVNNENGHWSVDASGDLDRFHVLRRDDATAATTGKVTYKGPLLGGTLSGRLQVVRSELRLGATYIPEVPLLRAKVKAAAAEKPSSIKLDVTLVIDDVIRVEGKGMEAFWRGDLHALGTLDTPDISGSLTLARGTFTFLGQSFDLNTGTITFTGGGTIDPELNITASKASGTLTATVTVTGPASHPSIALTSTPVMPQDEVLAQLLFRKSTTQLGPLESLQLASAAADLAGLSRGGLTGMLRRTFGLDILTFGGSGGQSVVLGHQISSSLYVGVEQSVATSSDRELVVEWRLTKSLSIQSTTNQHTGADLGIVWRKDY